MRSLAVLPFENAAGDPDAEYLSDGITESTIQLLSPLPKLRVMARGAVFRYKGRPADPQAVGRELDIDAVVMGRLVLRGDLLIVSVELVETGSGSQLWGRQYHRKMADLLLIQEEMAGEIAGNLRLKLTAPRSTQDPEAGRLYLKGRYYWNKRTDDCLRKSIEYFQQAIDKDPCYALAYAGLADSYALLGSAGYGPPGESLPKAKAAAMKALELDENLAEAHASLALIRFRLDWDWAGAEKEFQRAIALNPNQATARHQHAMYLGLMGRLDEAMEEIHRAQELDPLSLVASQAVSLFYRFMGRYDEAVQQCRKTLEMDPNFVAAHFDLGIALVLKGEFEQGLAEFEKALALSEGNSMMVAGVGFALAKAGRKEEARKVLQQLQELSLRKYVSPVYMAWIYAGLREVDGVVEWFEKAYEERSGTVLHFKTSPDFEYFHSDPRFQELMRKVGLSS